MPNVMFALPNIGGALCSTPQSLADAHYYTVSGKNGTILFLPLTFLNAGQFSKFFHQRT